VFLKKSSLIGQFKFNRRELKPIKTLQFKRMVGALNKEQWQAKTPEQFQEGLYVSLYGPGLGRVKQLAGRATGCRGRAAAGPRAGPCLPPALPGWLGPFNNHLGF
jgi:hypothetical protein